MKNRDLVVSCIQGKKHQKTNKKKNHKTFIKQCFKLIKGHKKDYFDVMYTS